MIASVDGDGDGCVGFEEFKKMMAPQPQGSATDDAAAPGGGLPDKAKKE